jgi:hypothetical protein
VAPGNSSSSADVIATFPVTLEAGGTYVAIANGVLDPDAFEANPDGRMIGFNLFPTAGLEQGTKENQVSVNVFHGSTDAPTVDVLGTRGPDSPRLVSGLGYGDASGYALLRATPYRLDITPAGDNDTIVVSYDADLTGLNGAASIVFASGFFTPSANQDGPAFGLFVALPDGTVLELPAAEPRPFLAGGLANNDGVPTLAQNSPNPFNPVTRIAFSLPATSETRLSVYNVQGQEVRRLVEGTLEAGQHSVEFEGSGLASGVYYYRLNAGSFTEIRKMTLVK